LFPKKAEADSMMLPVWKVLKVATGLFLRGWEATTACELLTLLTLQPVSRY
jgi:hypothetical protein